MEIIPPRNIFTTAITGLIKTIESESTTQYTFEKQYQYDGFGRAYREYYKASSLSNGKWTDKWIKKTFKYGHSWQLMDDTTNAVLWQNNTVNERGQLTSGLYGNSIEVTNTYDSYGFPTQRKHDKTGTNPGNVMLLNTAFNAQRGLLDSRSNSLFGWSETFTHDNLERLTGFTDNNGSQSQTYDNKGRIENNSGIGDYSYNTSKKYQATGVTLNPTGVAHYTNNPLQEVAYTTFKSPITIKEQGKEYIDFSYNGLLNRSIMYYGGTQADKTLRPLRKYYSEDGTMEIKRNITNGTVEFVVYVGGDAYAAPVLLKSDGTTQSYLYLHRDYIGSILAITNSLGAVVEKRQFDAWGSLVKLQDGSGNNLTTFALSDRGYTGHEHLLGVGLINMNGRLYDPKVHRFLMPDNYVQDPYNSQNYNRYGYVLNSPLKYSDPSGEYGVEVAVIIGAAVAAATYTITALTTDTKFTAVGLIKSTIIGAASAAVTFGIGELADGIANFYLQATFQTLAHGAFQGTMSAVQGGNFWVSFAAGALSSMASSAWQGGGVDSNYHGAGSFAHSTVGVLAFGTVAGGAGAALTGGNFWQGAVTGLVVSGLNHAIHDVEIQNEIERKFPRLYKTLGKLKSFVKDNSDVMEAFTKTSGYSRREVLKILSVKNLSSILTVDEQGDWGHFDPENPSKISIKAGLVRGLEAVNLSQNLNETSFFVGVTVLHEMVHYGRHWNNLSPKIDVKRFEAGEVFETNAFGRILNINGNSKIMNSNGWKF